MNELNAKLVADLKTLSGDVQQILQATAGDARQELAAVRERLRASAERMNANLGEMQAKTVAQTRAAVAESDRLVRDHPWHAVGIAAAVGLLVGLLAKTRD